MNHFNGKSLVLVLILTAGLMFCGERDSVPEKVLARVGDRVITVKDFKERAELTIRPPYCDGNEDDHKGIILNTLIAEKLLALDGAKESKLFNNPSYQNYLAGIKEQAMRNRMINVELENELNITNEEKLAAYKQSIKKLHVAYVYSAQKEEIENWKNEVDQVGFEAVEKRVNAGKKPHLKEVEWGENLLSMEKALFTVDVETGSVIGPVETRVGYYIFKVNAVRKEAVVDQGTLDSKLKQVEGVLFDRKWNKATAGYVYQLMKDKRIELAEEGFSILTDYYKPFYTEPDEDSLVEIDSLESDEIDREVQRSIKNNLDTPILTVNGETWTIGDLVQYTQRRPLMFGNNKIKENEFPQYLKLAIKNLITDKYLTDEAYDKGYDDDPVVVREEKIWGDYLLARGKRALLLKQLGFEGKVGEDYFETINVLRPQLNLIAKEYDVDINEAEYENLPLTGIQWKAIRQGVPYPDVVPELPVLTNDERIDYFAPNKIPGNK